MDRCGRRDAGHLHGGARHDSRERFPAAHRRQSFRHGGRVHLGAYVVSGRERRSPASYWLAVQLFRPQTRAHDLHCRVHSSFGVLRHGPKSALPDHLPCDPGRNRRRVAATLASHHAGSLPARAAWKGNGVLGPRHRGCAHAWSGDGRVDHR